MATQPKKVAVFDIDGTIFRSALSLELFHGLVEYGIFPKIVLKEIEEYHEDWINRRGSYRDFEMSLIHSFKKRLKGKVAEDIHEASHFVMQEKMELVYVYTRDLIDRLREEYFLLAISGSPSEIVNEFCSHWKFDKAYGAIYAQKDGIYTGEVAFESYLRKREILESFCSENEFTLKDSVGVGDTIGDVAFLEMVENPIAFNPSRELYDVAKERGWKIVVERKDMIYQL